MLGTEAAFRTKPPHPEITIYTVARTGEGLKKKPCMQGRNPSEIFAWGNTRRLVKECTIIPTQPCPNNVLFLLSSYLNAHPFAH